MNTAAKPFEPWGATLKRDRERAAAVLTLTARAFEAPLDKLIRARRCDGPACVARRALVVQSARAWRARSGPAENPTPEPGRPGLMQGRRQVMTPDGRWLPLGANLTQSPIAWLARRRDLDGQPWLNPLQAAAGERLRADAELASLGQRLTANHDALPRTGSGGGRGFARHPAHIAAARRVARALAAVDALYRPMVEAVCVNGSSLQLAENDLGVRRREGKLALREGLAQLARHYGR